MEKNQMIQLAVVVIAVGFIAEQLYFSSQGTGFNIFDLAPKAPSVLSGTAKLSGTVRNYDNIIVIDSNTSASTIDQIRKMDYVKSITQQPGYWLITTQSRDDIPTMAEFLNAQKIPSLSRVNIDISPTIQVTTTNGIVNASTYGQSQVIKVITSPIVSPGDEVDVLMDAQVQENVLVNYSSAQLLFNTINTTAGVRVDKINNITYEFVTAWENRSSLNSSADRVVNTIAFRTPLTAQQVIEKRSLDYITYISSDSAEVAQNFSDKGRILSDFAGSGVEFMPSRSVVVSQVPLNTTESPDHVGYNYLISFPPKIGNYDSGNASFNVNLKDYYPENTTIELNISAQTIGQKIYSIKVV